MWCSSPARAALRFAGKGSKLAELPIPAKRNRSAFVLDRQLKFLSLSCSPVTRVGGFRALPTDRAWQRIAVVARGEIQIIRLSCRRTGHGGGLGCAGLTLRPAGALEIELARQAYDGGDRGEASREYESGGSRSRSSKCD